MLGTFLRLGARDIYTWHKIPLYQWFQSVIVSGSKGRTINGARGAINGRVGTHGTAFYTKLPTSRSEND
jgi:uncharacterized Zn-binding protein involved in type VI secretion